MFGPGSGTVEISGGEFELNGIAVADLNAGLGFDEVFTGTLADGSVFIFARPGGVGVRDQLRGNGAVTLSPVALPAADPTPITVTTGPGPSTGLRSGQTLTLSGDGTLPQDFAAVNAALNIEGGTVGDGLEVAGTDLTISGGAFGSVSVYAGSTLHLTGTQFFADGTDITGTLTPGTAQTIATPFSISAVLADGSVFEIEPFGLLGPQPGYLDPSVAVSLTRLLLGDYNGDGFVSQADLDLVLLNWGDGVLPGGFDPAAIPGSGPFDGLVSQNELDGVLLNWGRRHPAERERDPRADQRCIARPRGGVGGLGSASAPPGSSAIKSLTHRRLRPRFGLINRVNQYGGGCREVAVVRVSSVRVGVGAVELDSGGGGGDVHAGGV